MNEDDRLMSMRGNNPHLSRATVHHELIAGHNLQAFMTSRYRTYRDFGSGFWTEGWSLYWELLLWDLKFPETAEDRVGMLFWHMHRCARIIFSLNYHLGKWTPQQRGKMTYKEYHDTILKLNAMPIEMIRAILERQPLTKDYTTKWRFYDNMKLPAN
jgi:uncharacterized protein (DUF885 family)